MANEKMEKPDFSKIWGENGNVTYKFSDDNYLKGWGFVGNIPPARGMFDAYFQRTDKKLKWLDGALGDYVNRDYTIDDTKNPTDNKDTLPNLLSGMANMIKTTNGTDDWKKPSATSLKDLSDQIASNNLYHAEATGYGIVSGCEPSIDGLTVTIGAGVIHTSDGRRVEVPEQSITLDAADVSRNDIVYFDKNCTVQVKKGTKGTDAELASTPTIDAETIEVCIVYINGSTTNIADARKFISTSAIVKRALPKYKSLSDTMGILLHVEYWGDTYLEVLYKSPYRIIRTTPMWSSCETEKGVYNFDRPLALAKKLAAHGKIGSWIMSFSNELYTSAGRSGINTDDARSAFANYCSAWVTALANAGIKGQIIEIYNEPNNSNFWSENNVISAEEYTKLVKCVYPKIKAADTTATVVTHNIMNGIYLSGMKWIKRTIDAGILDYTDGISIHPYVNAKPETMSNAYDTVRSLIAGATTKDIPVYVCEVGYSACQNYDGTTGLNAIAIESLRKKYIPRIFLNNLKEDIANTDIYCAFNLTDDLTVTDSEKLFGIYLHDGGSTDTSNAVEALDEILKNTKYIGTVYDAEQAVIMKFISLKGENIYIGWQYDDSVENKYIILSGTSISLTDTPQKIDIDVDLPIIKSYKKYCGYDVSHKSIVAKYTTDYAETYNADDVATAYENNCIVAGIGTKAIGSSSSVAGNYNIAGTDCTVAGNYNIAIGGTTVDITAIDGSTLTLSSVSNLSVGVKAAASGAWIKPLVCTILSIDTSKNKITIDRALSSSYTKLTYATSSSYSSIAFGASNRSTGYGSIAVGNDNVASGAGTLVAGAHNTMSATGGIACGLFANQVSSTDSLIVGNGQSSALSNAFRVTSVGGVYGQAAFNSTGADYAEYFEWADANTGNEDRVGYFVTFDDGNKIRKATSADTYILGVVSGNASVIGNSYNDQWQGMYARDFFGRTTTEEYTVDEVKDENGSIIVPAHTETRLKLNPDYDASKEYEGREKRAEWDTVGMLGVLPVRDDGTCTVNGYCRPNNSGMATSADTGYRVVSRVAGNIIKVLFR